MASLSTVLTIIASFVTFGSWLYAPISTRFEIFGVKRALYAGFPDKHGEGPVIIGDTYAAEDIHYYEPANLVFGIAEPHSSRREKYFPPMERFDHAEPLGQAHFFKIHPEEPKAIRLKTVDFQEPFVCHGFDQWADPADPESLYFIAVNHLPNPAYTLLSKSDSETEIPKTRSQIEIFHHRIGDDFVTHRRSVHHPLIRTPNDIYAVDKSHFYVTNDHFYREGPYRMLEDIGHEEFGAWSDVVYVSVDGVDVDADNAQKKIDGSAGVTVTVAMSDIQNPNGLGHGRTDSEILLGRATSGVMHTLTNGPGAPDSNNERPLNITSTLRLKTNMDNPSYFHDPYPQEGSSSDSRSDASGFVIAGLSTGITFPRSKAKGQTNPNVVWLVQPPLDHSNSQIILKNASMEDWTHKLIWSDDGKVLDSASTAVLVPIPPEKSGGGKKQAWLFVTGPVSEAVVRTKVLL